MKLIQLLLRGILCNRYTISVIWDANGSLIPLNLYKDILTKVHSNYGKFSNIKGALKSEEIASKLMENFYIHC